VSFLQHAGAFLNPNR